MKSNKAGEEMLNSNSKLSKLRDKISNYKQRKASEQGNPKAVHSNQSSYSKTSSREYLFQRRESQLSSKITESHLQGVYELDSRRGKRLFTKNLVPGKKVYDEIIFNEAGQEYREWNPSKSKLGAAIMKGVSQIGIMPGKVVLYLGCSTGTTCSHVSDILGPEGKLFGLDFAPRVMREFVFLCEDRPNMAPIIADAFKTEEFQKYLPEKVDVVFQDIAQRNQIAIFLKNCRAFLKDSGYGLLALKARSIDVTRNPKDIFAECKKELEQSITIVDYRDLFPFEKDHCIFVVKNK